MNDARYWRDEQQNTLYPGKKLVERTTREAKLSMRRAWHHHHHLTGTWLNSQGTCLRYGGGSCRVLKTVLPAEHISLTTRSLCEVSPLCGSPELTAMLSRHVGDNFVHGQQARHNGTGPLSSTAASSGMSPYTRPAHRQQQQSVLRSAGSSKIDPRYVLNHHTLVGPPNSHLGLSAAWPSVYHIQAITSSIENN